MNTTRISSSALRTTLIVIGILILAVGLLLTGLWIGRMGWGMTGGWPGGMMNANSDVLIRTPYRTGMMPNGMMNQGMMNGNSMMMNGNGMMQNGMMGGDAMMNQGMMSGGNMMGGGMMMNGNMMGTGMMSNGGLYAKPEPLSLETAKQALEKFLSAQDNDDLAISEIMIFDNHAYAEVVETSTGIGAMELLVDPVTLAVTPEHGPNRMWNLKYGMLALSGAEGMAGYGGGMPALSNVEGMGTMMGGGPGMMGNYGTTPNQPAEVSAEMPITLEEAVESAQRYLDTYLSGSQVDDHADVFYGYYTLHVLRDGQIVGMLSVNGYTREVFLHTWHGDFIEMGGGGE